MAEATHSGRLEFLICCFSPAKSLWPEGLIASLESDVESKELINNVRLLGSLRSAARTTMPLAGSGQQVRRRIFNHGARSVIGNWGLFNWKATDPRFLEIETDQSSVLQVR